MNKTPWPTPVKLIGAVRHYDWGGEGKTALIPKLLGIKPEPGKKYAELWFGTHPTAPSRVEVDGKIMDLRDYLRSLPGGARKGSSNKGELPFLVKILDVRKPLSLQVHPTTAQARRGFAREEAAGIPLGDPRRFYPDPHGKPELLIPLTPFAAFAGFRPVSEVREDLKRLPQFGRRRIGTGPGSETRIRGFFQTALARIAALEAEERRGFIRELISESGRRAGSRQAWVSRIGRARLSPDPGDPGFLILPFLRLLLLRPGEALYIPPGCLHTYLEGAALEVMPSADGVLRAGLTSKPISLAEVRGTVDPRARPQVFTTGFSDIVFSEEGARRTGRADAHSRPVLAAGCVEGRLWPRDSRADVGFSRGSMFSFFSASLGISNGEKCSNITVQTQPFGQGSPLHED